MTKDAWVLRLKNESKDSDMISDYFFLDDDESDWITDDLQKATIYEDKYQQMKIMKEHEKIMIEKYGKNAIMNFGYTHMMKHFEFVAVTVE